MKTLTAKQLRDELGQVVRRVQHGETIRVLYRSQPAFLLSPIESKRDQPEPGSKEAMQAFVREVRELDAFPRHSTLDPNKSFKQLYREHLDTDPKYQSPHD